MRRVYFGGLSTTVGIVLMIVAFADPPVEGFWIGDSPARYVPPRGLSEDVQSVMLLAGLSLAVVGLFVIRRAAHRFRE
jgi:hypothetical protein